MARDKVPDPLSYLQATDIATRAAELLTQAATQLRPDVRGALTAALARERTERGRAVLKALLDNDEIARRDGVPICQDTGTTWIRLELAAGNYVAGDLQAACDTSCGEASQRAGLRNSLVFDAYGDRRNTQTNTPVFIDLVQTTAEVTCLHVMLKGAGSDNASRIVMLDPDSTDDDIEAAVLAAVREKASMACPPLIIGIGIGGTFDTVGKLSKRALLRPLTAAPSEPRVAALQERLLAAVNATGIGPAALGGDTTALAVQIQTAPCHIAAKPLAINLCCNALRSQTISFSA
ncbi:MAG: fumarate hydratase [Coriobacteriia bacterium]|nr:fumarate hydratase [Coriobacteriia bacterium]